MEYKCDATLKALKSLKKACVFFIYLYVELWRYLSSVMKGSLHKFFSGIKRDSEDELCSGGKLLIATVRGLCVSEKDLYSFKTYTSADFTLCSPTHL